MTLQINKGRRKTFDIEYAEVTEDNMQEVATWCGGVVGRGDAGENLFIRLLDTNAMNATQTKAFAGDVVVKHLELHTFKKFTAKAFEKSYESVVIRHIARDAATGEIITETEAKENPEGSTIESVEHHGGPTETEKEADKNAALPRDADPS